MRKWLRELRITNNLKQIEIAEKLGMSQTYYSLIENGERQKDIDISIATKLAKLFNVTVEWIAEQEKLV